MSWQKNHSPNEQAETPLALSRAWLFGLLLAVITLAAFGPVCHAGFLWDDDEYVAENALLTAPDGLWRIWFSLDSPSQYFPLSYTTFYVERHLWGLHPTGYHLVNLLLHAANTLLVWRVLARLRVPGAWLAAAIFALHPVQVESVAWITERKNVLMGFLFLLALLAWIEFVDEQCQRPWRFYVLALVLYALALLAKTTACTLPAALLLILWLKGMPINWRRLGPVAPFAAMCLGMGLLTVWWERHHQGTQGKMFEIGWVDRVLIASRAVWFYAGKLLWPVHLSFSYPRWTISASDPRAYFWVLATLGLAVLIWRLRRWAGRSVEVAAAYYGATLSPVLGFIMLYTFMYSFVADHYQYLACIGPIALAVAGMKVGLGRVTVWRPFLQPALGAVLLMALGVLTWQQCGMYADLETLWQTTICRNPDSWLAHHELGVAFNKKGLVDEALLQYEETLQINPRDEEAHVNLGNILMQRGRVDEAISHFQQAVEISPRYVQARNNLANAFLQEGKLDEAIFHFRQALQINPGYAKAHNNLGNALLQEGKVAEAMVHFQQAVQLEPLEPAAQNNLAWLLATCPQDSLRNGAKAVELAKRASELVGGQNPVVLHTLAAALAEAGHFPEAVETARHAMDMAEERGNTGLAKELQLEMKLYLAGTTLHVAGQRR
jgi:tetratricopeptide (TPR) repeat protein